MARGDNLRLKCRYLQMNLAELKSITTRHLLEPRLGTVCNGEQTKAWCKGLV